MLVKAIVQCSSTIDLTVMVADHDSEAIDAFISTLIKKHLSPYAGMMDDEEPESTSIRVHHTRRSMYAGCYYHLLLLNDFAPSSL